MTTHRIMTLAILLLSLFVKGQEVTSQLVNIDTLKCASDNYVRQCSFTLRPGFNRLYDSTSLVMEGFSVRRHRRMEFVGLWTYYSDSVIVGYEMFDKKGRSISKIELYPNGKAKTIEYRWKKYRHSDWFLPNGQLVKTWEDAQSIDSKTEK